MPSSSEHTVSVTAALHVHPDARTRAALLALGWKPPEQEQDGGRETSMWNIAVHVPHGLEGELPALLERLGCEPYRMWKVEHPEKPEGLTGTSRKIGRDWARMKPGVQARLISFGGLNEAAYAWIDVRENSDG